MSEPTLKISDANSSAFNEAFPLLRAKDVRKTYRMGRILVPVLKNVSLDVKRGEWLAVLGASGSGKSTLLHLMGGLDRADDESGPIIFNMKPLNSMNSADLDRYRHKTVGFVFQFYHLLPELNVLENTLLPALVGMSRLRYFGERENIRSRARTLLESFGLGHRLNHRPRELSGGERQRVAIARALMNDPEVLLADEPTGNLDAKTGQDILGLLAAQHARGLTIVMVTHDQSIAAQADRSIHLVDGRVKD